MQDLLALIVFLVLMAIGYVFGRAAEKKHYISIRARENQYRQLILLTEKHLPEELNQHSGTLVCGNVVVSTDYFKVVVAGLKTLFGGRIAGYESLIDRARREALLRMQDEAGKLGATAIMNLKFETSRISGNAGQGMGSIEVLAYGTAMVPRSATVQHDLG